MKYKNGDVLKWIGDPFSKTNVIIEITGIKKDHYTINLLHHSARVNTVDLNFPKELEIYFVDVEYRKFTKIEKSIFEL